MPEREELPQAEAAQHRRKDLTHEQGIKPARHLAAKNSAEKHSGNQEQSRTPGHVAAFGVFEKGQQARRGNQGNQARALRPVLVESKQQAEQRHHQHASADADHACGHSAKGGAQEDRKSKKGSHGGRRRCRLGARSTLCFSPQQRRRQQKKKSENTAQASGGHRHREASAGVTAEQKPDRAANASAKVYLPGLPIFQQGAEANGRQKNEERRALRQVLVEVKKINHRRNQH